MAEASAVPPKEVLETLPESTVASIACHFASIGNVDGLRQLKEAGSNLCAGTTFDVRTPLHVAAASGNENAARFLVEECGAKLQKDGRGLLPIHDAIQGGHSALAKYLKDQKLEGDDSTSASIQSDVFEHVVKEGVFLYTTVQREVDYYFNKLGLHESYFREFTPAEISRHVHCLIASKRVGQTSKVGLGEVRFAFEEDSSALYLASLNPDMTETKAQKEVEDAAIKFIDNGLESSDRNAVSMIFMDSAGPLTSNSEEHLGLYSLKRSAFQVSRSEIPGNTTSIEVLASERFLKDKSAIAKVQYQIQMDEVVTFSRTSCRVIPCETYNGETCGGYVVMFTTAETSGRSYFAELSAACRFTNLRAQRIYMETFANGVINYTFIFPSASEEDAERFKRALLYSTLLKSSPGKSEAIYNGVMQGHISQDVGLYLISAVKFVYTFFPRERYAREYTDVHAVLANDPGSQRKLESLYKLCMKELLATSRIYDVIMRYVELAQEIFDDFKSIAVGESSPAFNEAISKSIDKDVADPQDRLIMKMFLTFNHSVLCTNFFAEQTPAAFSYRLNPAVVLKDRPASMFPSIPYGIYMVCGSNFMGFHCRFRDVARGGIRLVKSRNVEAYERNFANLFDECYNLSYTQQQKNKDIPEGGAKGVILPDSPAVTQTDAAATICFTRYLNALLDIMLPEQSKIFTGHMPGSDILYFGPDENTAGFMDLGANLARDRGYKYWKALTTGKSVKLGGIPHDVYGMTTASVHTYALELLKALGEDETQITKVQTGGPDGDLGSNEILVSKDKTKAIVDGSGVLYDPAGLNREELVRLAKARSMVCNFNRELLGEGAFLVTIDERDVTLPNGLTFRTGAELRDTFMLTEFAEADLLVPCGGRPNTITTENVNKLFAAGKPKFRMVVEGANLFLSNGAREVLEKAGVHLFKDASTNKGGVNSSSLEVFAALALSPEEHTELMTYDPANGGSVPEFYGAYAKQIVDTVRQNAKFEFDAVWKCNQTEKISKMECTARLSAQITGMQDKISENLYTMPKVERENLVKLVLEKAVPSLIVERIGVEGIIERVPQNYVYSIVGAWIASRYVYTHGIGASEVSFFFFMQRLVESAKERSESC